MIPLPVVLAAGVAVLAEGVRRYRRYLEAEEEARTARRLAAHKRRLERIADTARRQRDRTRRKSEYERRDELLDYLSAVQNRARDEIRRLEEAERRFRSLRGEQAERWIAERRRRRLPFDDVDAIRVELRKLDAEVGVFQFLRERAFQLIDETSKKKHELTSRSLHFRDAARVRALLPDETKFLEVPHDLPKKYDLVGAVYRPTRHRLELALPCGVTGVLQEGEPAPKRARRGSRTKAFVLAVDYRTMVGTVSLVRPKAIRAHAKDPATEFPARVLAVEAPGARLLVSDAIRAFMPRSLVPDHLDVGTALRVRIDKLDRYSDSPVAVPARPAGSIVS